MEPKNELEEKHMQVFYAENKSDVSPLTPDKQYHHYKFNKEMWGFVQWSSWLFNEFNFTSDNVIIMRCVIEIIL